MNKNVIKIISIVFVVGLISCYLYVNFINKSSAGNTVNYFCQEGNLKAQFGKNYVVLTFSDGKNILLPQTISGSGMRYELGTTTFIGKGDNAFLSEKGVTTYTNCVAGNLITKKDVNIFTDNSKTFSFVFQNQFKLSGGSMGYSQDWSAETSDLGLLLIVVNIPREFFLEKTNFGDAKFTVGTSADMKAVSNCLLYKYGPQGTTSEATINGVKFTKMNFTGAGAGNYYETTSYKTIYNRQCYAIEYTIHSMNIYNYPKEMGVKKFDKKKISAVFENIVQSFKFINK